MSSTPIVDYSWIAAQRWFVRSPFEFVFEMQKQYGDLVRCPAPFGLTIYFVYRPDHVHDLLVGHPDKLEKPQVVKRIFTSSFGNGLFFSEGDFWRRQRKLMQPAFNHARLNRYAERMMLHIVDHLSGWQPNARIDLFNEMRAMTLRVVVDALFNTDVRADTEQISKGMQDLGDAIAHQIKAFWLALLPDATPIPLLNRKRAGVAAVNQVIYRLMKERRASGQDRDDLLSVILFSKDPETGETMSDEQARDELMTLFIAGHETTAGTLGWALIEVARHPEVAAKLHEEVDRVLQGRTVTVADLPNLPYTAQVIKEALRMYPPAPISTRTTLQEITLNDGTVIPKGVICQFMPVTTHRDPRWYGDDSHTFRPERWQGDFERQLPKCAYFPFSAGPRICIGNGFALMEAQLALATLAATFSLTMDNAETIQPGIGTISLTPKETVWATVTRR
jgi:cytochrome P450